MTMDLAHQADFSVGSLRIRPAVLQVEWNGKSETLEPRIMQVLVVLGQRAGDVVSRDDLIKECWDGRAVGDDALNRCISRLRKLGEGSAAFGLETIPRVGYRLKPSDHAAHGVSPTADQHVAAMRPAAATKKQPGLLFIGGAALAVLAIAGIAAVATLRQPASLGSAAPVSQRTAFFGFTADGDDAAAAGIAKSATSETFQALSAIGIETASESQTQNIQRGEQLERAKTLRARYALAGEVRREGDHFTVLIRLEDVEAGTTLLQDPLSGNESQKASLPARIAARAANVLQCYIPVRNVLRTETDDITRALMRVCNLSYGSFIEQVEARRELARLASDSPEVQTNFALWLFLSMPSMPAADRPVMRLELDKALKASLAADPHKGIARTIQADLLIIDGGDLSKAEPLFREALKSDPNLFFPNIRYGIFLRSVGSSRVDLQACKLEYSIVSPK